MPSTNLSLNLNPNHSKASVFPGSSISPPLTPTSPTSSPPVTEITFYNAGDLILELYNQHNEKFHLRVASAALCIASPVFRAMLSPDGFREGKALSSSTRDGNVFVLPLPDDDPEAFITLCHILHFNNQKVPRKISTDGLANLCVLLDKYVCTMAAVTWLDFWFSHIPQADTGKNNTKMRSTNVNQQIDDVKWLYISFVTGDKQKFMHFSAKVIMDLPSMDLMSDNHVEWFERLPGSVQDALYNASQDVIQDVAGLIEEFCLGKLSKCQTRISPSHTPSRNSPVPSPRDCEAHSIGALVQSLQNEQLQSGVSALYLVAQPRLWNGSANELLEKMEGLADNLASSRPFVAPHHQCCHGRTLYRKLRELRFSKSNKGLDLADYRGNGK